MCLGATVRVVGIDPVAGTATVVDGERQRVVSLVLRPETHVGDLVVVHTGFVVDAARDHAVAPDTRADTTTRRQPY